MAPRKGKRAIMFPYYMYEWQRAMLQPFRLAAAAAQGSVSHPANPFGASPAMRSVAAACELFEGSSKRYDKPDFRIATIKVDGVIVPVKEVVIQRTAFCDLLHFRRDAKRGHRNDPPVLLVAPLSGHYATLLRDTVTALLPDHDVYVTDWQNARDVPVSQGPFELDDYIELVMMFLRRLGPGTNVVAVCQPSVPVLAAVSLMAAAGDPARPKSMTLMGGPIDSRRSPTVPNRLATTHPVRWFERNMISRVPASYPGFMRRVYPGYLQLWSFMAMNWDRHVGAHLRQFQNLITGADEPAQLHRKFYAEYQAVMDLPAEYYLQTVKTVFQEHALPRGLMRWRGEVVEPKAIHDVALMTVEGELDDISGLGQTQAAHDLCVNIPQSARVHYEQKGVGHYGVFGGSKWRTLIAPRVRDFIRTHNT